MKPPLKTAKTLALLRAHESRNVTFMEADGSWPIVWARARGVDVWDAEGRKYLDLTAAFGVAAAGHANPRVVRAGQRQMETLLHAMGDVHPHSLKAELARELSRLTFERWGKARSGSGRTGKTIFCNSGFEAVEAALKTAVLATGKRGVIAFTGAYHGLGYGALNATHREHFRGPFRSQLREFGHFLPFPVSADVKGQNQGVHEQIRWLKSAAEKLFRRHDIGAVLVEPIQARGGIRVPPPDFLRLLREVCDRHGALLIVDEIYTGFGRTGKWFACEHSGVVPDVICLGKALTGGYLTLAATLATRKVADGICRVLDGDTVISPDMLGKLVGLLRDTPDAAQSLVAETPVPAALVASPMMVRADDPIHQLSPREREILALIAKGDSNKHIARALDIAETTVKIHVQHILRKLSLTNRVHAAVYASERGLV